MQETIPVQLTIQELIDPARITEEEIATLPLSRQDRIRRMKHEQSKSGLFTAGILLRDILGVRQDEDLFFTEKEKPYLKSKSCFFSLSHNSHYVVLATAPVEIGVDVEELQEFKEPMQRRVFTEEERRFIVPDPIHRCVFLWTRLEAALKLSGEGIGGIDSRTFSLLEDTPSCCFCSLEYSNSIISVACTSKMSLHLTTGDGFLSSSPAYR